MIVWTNGYSTMMFLKAALRFTRRALLSVFAVYWAALVCGSIEMLVSGGPVRLAAWYEHIAEGPLVGNCVADTCTFSYPWLSFRRLGWGGFAAV